MQQALSGGGLWAQFFNQSSPNQGTFSLTISATGPALTSGANKAWASPHGTFTATLKPVAGTAASGDVNVSVTF